MLEGMTWINRVAVHNILVEDMKKKKVCACFVSYLLTHTLTHGAVSFLRGYPRTSQHFMEHEGSLPYSQKLSTGLYSKPDQSNLYHLIPSKIHFNIVHPTTSWPSQWSPSFWLSHHRASSAEFDEMIDDDRNVLKGL
jgi:hypothetical protein